MLWHGLITYFTIFLAELPDKTMLATLMLSSKHKNRLAVWAGVSLGYTTHVVVAVLFGTALSKLPSQPIHVLVGLMFIMGGVLILRMRQAAEAVVDGAQPELRWARIVWLAASVILVAEFADMTQLATVGLAVRFEDPSAVAVAAALALISVSGLAVLAGSWIQQHVPLRVIQRVAGALFCVIGATMLIAALV